MGLMHLGHLKVGIGLMLLVIYTLKGRYWVKVCRYGSHGLVHPHSQLT